MNYCYTDDWGCPYYVPETGACLLVDPELKCADYAACIDEIMGMVDMYALNPQPPLQGAKAPGRKLQNCNILIIDILTSLCYNKDTERGNKHG